MNSSMEISVETLASLKKDTFTLIDVREPWEKKLADIGGELIPLDQISLLMHRVQSLNELWVLYCHHGMRSLWAVNYLVSQLKDRTDLHIKSLSGGIDKWSIDIDISIPRY